MTAQKSTSPGTPTATPAAPSTPTSTTSRKAWVKKTPVEIVLEQIGKQEEKVAGMRKELARGGTRTYQAATGKESPGGAITSHHHSRGTLYRDAPLFVGNLHDFHCRRCCCNILHFPARERSCASGSVWSATLALFSKLLWFQGRIARQSLSKNSSIWITAIRLALIFRYLSRMDRQTTFDTLNLWG
jgi:hypothetical protein